MRLMWLLLTALAQAGVLSDRLLPGEFVPRELDPSSPAAEAALLGACLWPDGSAPAVAGLYGRAAPGIGERESLAPPPPARWFPQAGLVALHGEGVHIVLDTRARAGLCAWTLGGPALVDPGVEDGGGAVPNAVVGPAWWLEGAGPPQVSVVPGEGMSLADLEALSPEGLHRRIVVLAGGWWLVADLVGADGEGRWTQRWTFPREARLEPRGGIVLAHLPGGDLFLVPLSGAALSVSTERGRPSASYSRVSAGGGAVIATAFLPVGPQERAPGVRLPRWGLSGLEGVCLSLHRGDEVELLAISFLGPRRMDVSPLSVFAEAFRYLERGGECRLFTALRPVWARCRGEEMLSSSGLDFVDIGEGGVEVRDPAPRAVYSCAGHSGRLDRGPAGVIVDNDDPGFEQSGPQWRHFQDGRPYGLGYLALPPGSEGGGPGDDYAAWRFKGLEPGTYALRVYWDGANLERCPACLYEVKASASVALREPRGALVAGEKTAAGALLRVDQSACAGRWVELCRLAFPEGETSGEAWVSLRRGERVPGAIVADAVMLERLAPPPTVE